MDQRKPYLIAILVQAIYAGMFLLSKAALDSGMSCFVFTFYRQAAATVFLIPVAILFERKEVPELSFNVFLKMFLLALFGITSSLNLYGVALGYTTSTLAAATSNTLPAITFGLAVLLRMEIVHLKKVSGTVKAVGIAVSLAGAAVIAFYKGSHLNPFHHHYHLNADPNHGHSTKSWIKGVFLMLFSNFLWGMWLVLQGPVLKCFPSKLLFTTILCLLSTIQSFFVALAFDRDISRWKLGLDIGLLAVVYSGIVVTGFTFYLQAWCVEKRGPVFLAVFTPLSLVITMICSVFFLGEMINMGR
ncbi:WAT1-related protein At5g64700 [Aristolochia californica]|uniref:WAT1-related protein At5g64700 n=1 Tax=Aristolochia californica TaxID=171875 RepID=UPI0035DF45BF